MQTEFTPSEPKNNSLQIFFALLSGIVFGIGLAISGMVNPAQVLAFLDVAGDWDPTLALVMVGALAVSTPAFRTVLKRPSPWFGPHFALPDIQDLELRLVLGSGLFGVGWGLAGLCPGPAITDLVTGNGRIALFVGAMLAGAWFYDWFNAWAEKQQRMKAMPIQKE